MESFSSPCGEVVTALAKVQATLGGTLKPTRKVNAGQRKYEYIELDAILTAALPVLEANGLAVLHTQDASGVDCYLMHTSGQWIRTHAQVEVGPDLSAQDVGSAYTYARRYSLTAMFALAAGDDDGAAATDARKTAQAKAKEKEPEPEVAPKDWAKDPWEMSEEASKFYGTLAAAGVALSPEEIRQIAAAADRPGPSKMGPEQLAKFTAYLVKTHGQAKAAK